VSAPDEVHVMSFNLRFADDAAPHSWGERRPLVSELLRRERPHLIGTQEGLHHQLQDIEADLPGCYESIGQGREGGNRGEAMRIFYDSHRLEPLEHHDYWLSDTPDVAGSKTWGGCCPRMVTWARFHDRGTGAQLYALNTHLEAYDADARVRSAVLILRRLRADLDPAVPVVLTGDFNEPAGPGPTYDRLVTGGPLVDTWAEAERRGPQYGTFHDYRSLVPGGDRIDWILTSSQVRTRVAWANDFRPGGQYPSDHLPVQAVLRFPAA